MFVYIYVDCGLGISRDRKKKKKLGFMDDVRSISIHMLSPTCRIWYDVYKLYIVCVISSSITSPRGTLLYYNISHVTIIYIILYHIIIGTYTKQNHIYLFYVGTYIVSYIILLNSYIKCFRWFYILREYLACIYIHTICVVFVYS